MRDFLKFFARLFALSGALAIVGLLPACFSDSNADSKDSGLTKAEVEAMIAEAIAPLQNEITALKTGGGGDAPYNRLYVSNDSATAMMKATADGTGTTLADLGDPIDCRDEGVSLRTCRIITSTGFLAEIPLDKEDWRPWAIVPMYYALPDCQGEPYVTPQTRPFVIADANKTYYYRLSDVRDTVTVLSEFRNNTCINIDYSLVRDFSPVWDNDPAITGLESVYESAATFGR